MSPSCLTMPCTQSISQVTTHAQQFSRLKFFSFWGHKCFFFKKENTGMVTEIDFACAKQIVQALALVAPTGSLVT